MGGETNGRSEATALPESLMRSVIICNRFLVIRPTGDWSPAAFAAFGEKLSVAVAAEFVVAFGDELLVAQQLLAVGAPEALTVQRLAAHTQPTFVDYLHCIC